MTSDDYGNRNLYIFLECKNRESLSEIFVVFAANGGDCRTAVNLSLMILPLLFLVAGWWSFKIFDGSFPLIDIVFLREVDLLLAIVSTSIRSFIPVFVFQIIVHRG